MAEKQEPHAKNSSVRALCPIGATSTETHQMQPGHTRSGSGFVCSTRNWRPVGYIPVISRILPEVPRGIIPLCPKFIRFPYSAQEQRNVKEDFLRKTGFPMASHPDCAHSDSLGMHVQYSTCPCAVGSGAQHAEGKVAMFGCIGRETAICPRKGLPDHPSLLCATQHLSKPWHR